jgi:tetratricopeptide (TPR) repeat protein
VVTLSKKEKLISSAQKSLLKGQTQRAIKDYQKLVEIDPRDIRNRQKLAELYGRVRMVKEALDEYELVAKYYAENGFYLKAIAVYKQIQKLDPEQVNAYHRLAELNEKQGLVGNALAEYRNLVAYYEKQQQISEAVDVLQKMKGLEPENLNIRVKIVECCMQAGHKDKGRAEFQEILAILEKKEDFARILQLYEKNLTLFPGDFKIETGLGKALISTGQVEKGIQILKNLLLSNPEDAGILRLLVQGYRKKGDFENERLTYQHLLEKFPGDLDLQEGYIQTFFDAGEHDKALLKLEEWKSAFFDANRVSTLKGFYEKLKQALPGNSRVHTTLRSIYEITGEGGKLFDIISATPEKGKISLTAKVETPKQVGTDSPKFEEAVEELKETSWQKAAPEESTASQEESEMELELELELKEPFEEVNSSAADSLTLELEETQQQKEQKTEKIIDQPAGLEEAEFYLQQGLLDDAEKVCRKLLEADMEFGEAQEMLLKIEGLRRETSSSEEAEEEYFDLAKEIMGAVPSEDSNQKGTLFKSSNEIGAQTNLEDVESHYNLGIAYKEMGKLDDAISEFDKTMKNPARVVDCLTLKGICFVEKGCFEDAEEAFKSGLAHPGLNDGERISLHYEKGLLYEAWGRSLDALDSFQYVADFDPSFRNIGEKMRVLKEKIGLDNGKEGDESEAKRENERVFYG